MGSLDYPQKMAARLETLTMGVGSQYLRLIDSRQFQENGVGVWWIPEDDPLALCEILYFLILCWWKC
jgi:hypothetical protein